jgi:hypothetical protein
MSDTTSPPPLRGPIEDRTWPTTLEARVVQPGDAPRIHGYDVQGDLAPNYSFAELVLTTLLGEVPNRSTGRLFDAVLSFLAPCSVAEGPTHAALLVRTCGARAPAVLASGAVTLSEEAAAVLHDHAELLQWLDAPSTTLPARYRSESPAEENAVNRFAACVRASGATLPIMEQGPTLRAALLAAAYHCGLRDAERLQAMWLLARLPAVMAEALHRPVAELRRYPIDLPRYEYIAAAKHERGDP